MAGSTILRRRVRNAATPATSREPSARFVTADGTALHVVDSVPGSMAGTGPATEPAGVVSYDAPVTVMLVHGWTLDHRSWEPVVRRLGIEFAEFCSVAPRVLRYDHRGHGGSAPAAGTATIAQLADDLAELILARVPTGKIVLAGHSMGGMTVMALAERHADLVASRVAAVALLGTSSCGMDRTTLGLPGVFGRAAARGERWIGKGVACWRRPVLLNRPALLRPFVRWLVFGRGVRKADVAEVTAQIGRVHPMSMAGFRDSIGAHDRRLALAELRGRPCVVAVGDRDRLCPLPHARVIADALPEARLVVHPGAGHMLAYERPEETAAAIARMVRAVS